MKKSICYFYVVFGAACWGFIGLFNRMLGDVGVSVGTRVTVRNLFALALLTVIFGLFHRQVFHIQARHLPIFLGAGILSVLGMAVAYFQCQMLCSLAVAGVLLYLAPSFVVLMSAALWRAPITKRKLAALALALLGCAFVSGIAGGGLTVSLGGILLGVAAGFCYATYTIFAHYGLQHYDSYTMTYWTFMFAGIGSLFFLKPAELPLGVRKLTRCARDAGACRRIDGAALYLLYQGARGRGERQGLHHRQCRAGRRRASGRARVP